MRKLCVLYWLMLTLLLLSRNPLAWFGHHRTVTGAYHSLEPVMHFVCFTLLGLLVCATQLPLARIWLVALLVGYSVATELLQALVPGRVPDVKDFVQNVAGLAFGAVLCWLGRRALARWRNPQPPPEIQIPRRRIAATVRPGVGEVK